MLRITIQAKRSITALSIGLASTVLLSLPVPAADLNQQEYNNYYEQYTEASNNQDWLTASNKLEHIIDMSSKTSTRHDEEYGHMLNRLAKLYEYQGRILEAKTTRDTLTIFTTTHPHLFSKESMGKLDANNKYDLTSLTVDLGHYKEAESILAQSLKTAEQARGDRLFYIRNDLADLYSRWGKLSKAKDLLNKNMTLASKNTSSNQADLLRTTKTNLAVVLRRQGQLDEAKTLLTEVLKSMPENVSAYRKSLSQIPLAITLTELKEYDAAQKLFTESIKVRESYPNKLRLAVAKSYLADLHVQTGQLDLAEQEYRFAIDNYKTTVGEQHPYVALAYDGLGKIAECRNQSEEAKSLYKQALVIQTNHLDAQNPELKITLNALAKLQ